MKTAQWLLSRVPLVLLALVLIVISVAAIALAVGVLLVLGHLGEPLLVLGVAFVIGTVAWVALGVKSWRETRSGPLLQGEVEVLRLNDESHLPDFGTLRVTNRRLICEPRLRSMFTGFRKQQRGWEMPLSSIRRLEYVRRDYTFDYTTVLMGFVLRGKRNVKVQALHIQGRGQSQWFGRCDIDRLAKALTELTGVEPTKAGNFG